MISMLFKMLMILNITSNILKEPISIKLYGVFMIKWLKVSNMMLLNTIKEFMA